ncbi:hypothetical protein MsAg5_05550 [Methanosarcinaceae archaeon Ag5]|uniref:Ig-like domain-containing protein n=1 Tax=Methanolapillus africanus TaxID=3028297 RepID=A0AAE4MKA0_9EURY|nr:hypothetical protein [Methanosarcinaceae archaeon Ag5]
MSKQKLKYAFLLLIALLAIAMVPNTAMAAHIYTDLYADYHVVEGESVSMVFEGGPDTYISIWNDYWVAGSGFEWKYKNDTADSRSYTLYPNDKYEWKTIGANITVSDTRYRYLLPWATTTLTIDEADSKLDGMKFNVSVGKEWKYTSQIATLHVYKKAEIETQPEDAVAFANTSASFTVAAKNEGATYQWYKSTGTSPSGDYQPISGATGSTYTLDKAAADGHYYKVKVTGKGPSSLNNYVESTPAKLTVLPTPTVTPNSLGENSENVVFDTEVTAENYVWKKVGVSDALSNGPKSYTIVSGELTVDDTGYYTLTITTTDGKKLTSEPIFLNVFSKELIDKDATIDQYVAFAGKGATLTVELDLPVEITSHNIEWTFKGQKSIPGDSFVLTSLDKAKSGNYEVKVTGYDNEFNEYTDTMSISLTVLAQPVVMPAATFAGNSVNFYVEEMDGLTYEWMKNESESQCNTVQYEIEQVGTSQAGEYHVNVTVGTGPKTVTARSNDLWLTVYAKPGVSLELDNETVFAGKGAVFTATVSGSELPGDAATTVRWYGPDGKEMTNGGQYAIATTSTGSTLTLSKIGTSNGGNYYAVAETTLITGDSCTVKSNEMGLTVFELIMSSPTVKVGESVTFSIENLPGDLAGWEFDWYKNGVEIEENRDQSTLIVSDVKKDQDGDEYYVKVTVGGKTLESNTVVLDVTEKSSGGSSSGSGGSSSGSGGGGTGQAKIIDNTSPARTPATVSPVEQNVTTPTEQSGAGFENGSANTSNTSNAGNTTGSSDKKSVPWVWIAVPLLLIAVVAIGYFFLKKK